MHTQGITRTIISLSSSQCRLQPISPPFLSFLFIVQTGMGTIVNINNKGCDSDSLCYLVQWSVTSVPVSDYLSSILILFPLSFQYHPSYYADPLFLLCHCDYYLSTPFEGFDRLSSPLMRSPWTSAISRKTGGCISPSLTLSYVTLEKTRQLLRDHFERNDTAPIIALIGTADE